MSKIEGQRMSIRRGLQWYYGLYGVRGVLTISCYRLFGRPKSLTVRPPGIRNPVQIRLKTSDESVYKTVLLDREYSFDLPFSPKIILDAGANIGTASIYFAHRYPKAKIIAVEVEASNFAALVKNTRPYPAVKPLHAAIWNRDGEIAVSEPESTSGANGNGHLLLAKARGLRK
jgi:hypothetical protein